MKFESGSRKDRMLSEINMVPFIDVVLVLLIIFMVTTPLLYRGLKINLPKTSANSLKKPVPKVIVSVTKGKQIFVNGHAVTWEALGALLARRYKEDKRVVVYLKADRKVDYGTVVHLMDVVKMAGIDRLGMITAPSPKNTE